MKSCSASLMSEEMLLSLHGKKVVRFALMMMGGRFEVERKKKRKSRRNAEIHVRSEDELREVLSLR